MWRDANIFLPSEETGEIAEGDADLGKEVEKAMVRPCPLLNRDAIFQAREPQCLRPAVPAVHLGQSWGPGAQSLTGKLAELDDPMKALIKDYSADDSVRQSYIQSFGNFLQGRPATEALLSDFLRPLQQKVAQKTLMASSLATYTNYIVKSAGFRCLQKCRLVKAIRAQGGHLGGSCRAPTVPPKLKKKIVAYMFSKPVDHIKVGMWFQAHIAAPRSIDVARLRGDCFIRSGRMRTHWSFTKSIRDSSQAKTVPDLEKVIPPFSEAWWKTQTEENRGQPLRQYTYQEANAQLKVICAGYNPMPTSTSLRLLFIERAVTKSKGNYAEAARYTVHRTGQTLSAAYDAPRTMSVKE